MSETTSPFETHSLTTFDAATALPDDVEEAQKWQEANRSWWEDHPMRYDWREDIQTDEHSRTFYQEIDERFFSAAATMMPWKEHPFEALIDFAALPEQDTLEIGVGCGSHAQLLATHAKSFTGIDLTDYAIEATTKRLKCFDIEGRLLRMDAENLEFESNSFDFIWTWGVIHHSSDTQKILQEMKRVLRPGGKAVVMVYHSSWWINYVIMGFIFGCIRGEFFRGKSLHQITQDHTDGAIARYYTSAQWRQLASPNFDVLDIRVYGQKEELIPLPASRVKRAIVRMFPNGPSRFFTNRLKMGSFLVSTIQKAR